MIKPDDAAECGKKTRFNSKPHMHANYESAQAMMQCAFGSRKMVNNSTVTPHWNKGHDSFWYRKEIRGGHHYHLVDIDNRTNAPAFDHVSLSSLLSAASGEKVEPDQLPLQNLEIDIALSLFTFTAFGCLWQ